MRGYLFLLIGIGVLLALTLPAILGGNLTFAFDMGRDLLWVRNMIELKKPTLIGPWGSIAGVYFGPLWYYLLAIPYLVFNGDPRGAVIVPLMGNISTIIIGWWFLRRQHHPIAANLFVLLYSISPLVISTSTFAFHANLLPLVTLFFLIGLYKGLFLRSARTVLSRFLGLPLAALMVSLTFHLEPAAAVMLTVFLIFWLIVNKSQYFKTSKTKPHSFIHLFIYSSVVFAAPFVLQVIFEFRHQFIQTKSLLAYFAGENRSLGGVLPLSTRISERITKLSNTLTQSLFPIESVMGKWLLMGLFLGAIFLTLRRLKKKDQFMVDVLRLTLYFIFFHYLAYTFLFPAELKGWYLDGLVIFYLLPVALLIEQFLRRGKLATLGLKTRQLLVGTVLVVAFFYNTNFFDRFFGLKSAPPPETVAAQLEVVDWIFQDVQKDGRPFAIYTYTPPIYDYNFQYLIWWRGSKTYQLLPAEFSYLPGKTAYLPNKERFISKTWEAKDRELVYLIIEPEAIESRVKGWLGHFAALKTIKKVRFPSGLELEKRNGS